MPRLVRAVNAGLDRLVRPFVTLAGRRVSPFRLCGYVGLGVAIVVSQLAVAAHDVSPLVMVWLTLTAVVTFLVLVTVTTLVMGREIIVYYHHQVAVLTTCIALLWVLDEPILAYLDAVILGVGGFLACGRIGCLLVGCCHGRPARLGACYRHEHADEGFTPGYVGVRLLPVPVLESFAVAGIIVAGIAQVEWGAPPGRALVWYVVAYAAVRSWLELLRGDPGRPHAWGLSHGQWTSLALVAVAAGLTWTGLLPGSALVCGVALAVTSAAGLRAWRRWRSIRYEADVLSPRHLAEVAEMLQELAAQPPGLHVCGPSSAGVIISSGGSRSDRHSPAARIAAANADADADADSPLAHYALSARPISLSPGNARSLARAVLRIRHPEAVTGTLLAGLNGVHHLLVGKSPPEAAPTSPPLATADRSDSDRRQMGRNPLSERRPAGTES